MGYEGGANLNDIVLFMVDQLSAKWVETAIERQICPLPNLKELMSEGVTFRYAISSNPVCCPSRSTIATGMTTRGHGVLENGYRLDSALPTFMKSLQSAGMRTGAFGKLHFVPHEEGFGTDYHAYGFDVTKITDDSRGGQWLDWAREKAPEQFDNVLATVWADHIPEFSRYGECKEDLAEKIRTVRHRFDWTQGGKFPRNSEKAYTLPFSGSLSQTEWITERAVEFIKETPVDIPIFTHISYVQPHNPYSVPEQYIAMVDESAIPEALPAEWRSDLYAPSYFKRQKEFHLPDERWARICYFADLVHLDRQLGIIRKTFRECGRGDIYILFTSDHGDLLGDHGFYFKEERHYDACIRVPLVISGPYIRRGAISGEMVQTTDLCPTILDMAGTSLPDIPVSGPYLRIPPEQRHPVHGKSLLEHCCSGEKIRDIAYVESYNPIWSNDYTDWARTVRTSQFRYTYYAGGGEQLFDLQSDPGEQINLVQDLEYAKYKQNLKDNLTELIIRQDWPKTTRELFAFGVH